MEELFWCPLGAGLGAIGLFACAMVSASDLLLILLQCYFIVMNVRSNTPHEGGFLYMYTHLVALLPAARFPPPLTRHPTDTTACLTGDGGALVLPRRPRP